MKRFLTLLVTAALCMSALLVFVNAEDGIAVVLDGKEVVFDVSPQIIDGRTMVPIRAIFEALGADVSWDEKSRTVTATIDDYEVKCTVDSKVMTVCGERVEMDVPPIIVGGRTLMPARFAAEAFGCSVSWNGTVRTAEILSYDKAAEDSDLFIPGDDAHITYAPDCVHEKYDRYGFCENCKEEFSLIYEEESGQRIIAAKSVPARVRPYAVCSNTVRFEVGDELVLLGRARNCLGKDWCLVRCNRLGGSSYWIYSENVVRPNEVSITLGEASGIGDGRVSLKATCSYTVSPPSHMVLLLGTSEKDMKTIATDAVNHSYNPFDIKYNVSNIKNDVVYYYRVIAKYDTPVYGDFASKIGTFKMPSGKEETTVTMPDTDPIDKVTDGLLDAIVPVTLRVTGVSRVDSTAARFNASCTYIGNRPDYVCLYIGLSADTSKMWQVGYDAITHGKNPFDIWYDVSGMAENTIYYYQFRAYQDGKLYTSDVHTVTTANTKPIDSAMDTALGMLGIRTGVVSGTTLLAINDKAAASPTHSTMIGTIPSGATVTVYTDKQSGNWYYVSYNGISGYAYGAYITLK